MQAISINLVAPESWLDMSVFAMRQVAENMTALSECMEIMRELFRQFIDYGTGRNTPRSQVYYGSSLQYFYFFSKHQFWFGSGFIYVRINLYMQAEQKKKLSIIFLFPKP